MLGGAGHPKQRSGGWTGTAVWEETGFSIPDSPRNSGYDIYKVPSCQSLEERGCVPKKQPSGLRTPPFGATFPHPCNPTFSCLVEWNDCNLCSLGN